jgi:hypothetical protein
MPGDLAAPVKSTQLSGLVQRDVSARGFLTKDEWALWQEHLKQSGDLSYRDYPVFMIDQLDQPLTTERLKQNHVLVIRPGLTDRVLFPEWLGHEHLFDWNIASECKVIEEVVNAFRVHWRKFSQSELPGLDFKYGAVFLLDQEYGKIVQNGIDDAEAFRQLLFKSLPKFKYVALERSYDSILIQETISRRNLTSSDTTLSARLVKRIPIGFISDKKSGIEPVNSIAAFALGRVISTLSVNIGEYFTSTTKFITKTVLGRFQFKLKYSPFIGPFRSLKHWNDLSRTESDQLIDRIYALDVQEGTFIFPSADGREFRVGESWIRASCQVIQANFTCGIGRKSKQYTYDTSGYSSETLRIFVDCIYRRPFPENLSLETLFELYRLFGELGCIDSDFARHLNCHLLTHLDQLADPSEIIQNILEYQPHYPELREFRNQLEWLSNQVRKDGPLQLTKDECLDFASSFFKKYLKQSASERSAIERFFLSYITVIMYCQSRNSGVLVRRPRAEWTTEFIDGFMAQLPSLEKELFGVDVNISTIEIDDDKSHSFTITLTTPQK